MSTLCMEKSPAEYLYECSLELALVKESMNMFEEIDPYCEIFEAQEDPNTKAQIDNNNEAKSNSESHLKKAMQAIINAINSLMSRIKNVFSSKKLNDKESELHAKMNIAKKEDPSLLNQKVNVLDVNKFNNGYESLLKEAEDADKQLSAGRDLVIEPILNKISNFCKSGANAITISVGMEAALQAASSSKEIAQKMTDYLANDRELEERLMESIGKKEYKSFKKDVGSMTKRVSLRQSILRLKGYKAKSFEDAINTTFSQCDKLLSGIGSIAAVAVKNPVKDDGSMSKPERMLKTAKHYIKNRKEVVPAAKDIVGNNGVKIAKRIMGNEDISNVAKFAMGFSGDNSKYKRELYKKNQQAQKEAIKKDSRLRRSKNKSNQSLMDSIRGTYDDNSKVKNSKLANTLINLSNKL